MVRCAVGSNKVKGIFADLLIDNLLLFIPVGFNRDPALLHYDGTVLPTFIIRYSRSIATHMLFSSSLITLPCFVKDIYYMSSYVHPLRPCASLCVEPTGLCYIDNYRSQPQRH